MSKNEICNSPLHSQLIPAQRAFNGNGTLYSPFFEDVYHSIAGAFEQAQHVFITGNALIKRWAHHQSKHFVILETGFGLGVNFLATWMAWRHIAKPNTCLHFVSIEKHPFIQKDLHELLLSIAPPNLHALIQELCIQWPVLTQGLHRLEFDQGRVVLTLCFGDIQALLPQLQLQADAFYLDGFSPAKNPDMWTLNVCQWLSKLAHQDATLATYTVAGQVCRNLRQVGFQVQKVSGFKKRGMLVGHFEAPWLIPRFNRIKPHSEYREKHALVIGAGLAGCAITHALIRRGWTISLLDQCDSPAQQASGISLGLFHPVITQDNSLLSRATRAGFLLALQHFKKLSAADCLDSQMWKATGLLKIAKNEEEARIQDMLSHKLAYPKNLVLPVTAKEASELANTPVNYGGWYFPEGGWVKPSSLCLAQLSGAGSHLKTYFGKQVAQLIWCSNQWHAIHENGHLITEAPIVILANAQGALKLLKQLHTHLPPTQEIRGQLTTLSFTPSLPVQLSRPIVSEGYIIPLDDANSAYQNVLIGASYDRHNPDNQPNLSSYHGNLGRLAKLLPTFPPITHFDHFENSQETHYACMGNKVLHHEQVAFRCASKDRLPLVGAIFQQAMWDPTKASRAGIHRNDLPRFPGLYGAWAYGSRGLIWATLGAELLASQLEGEPLPIENTIAAGFDPARFFLRKLRM